MILKGDLHVHSFFSRDSTITTKDIIKAKISKKLDFVAITDHDEYRGGIKFKKALRRVIEVIPGIEISTREGHILVLGIGGEKEGRKYVKMTNKSIFEVIDQAKDDNLIVIVAHPLDIIRNGVGVGCLKKIIDYWNGVYVETLNAASPLKPFYAKLREDLIGIGNIKQVGGSDAHIPDEIGVAGTIVNINHEINSALESLMEGDTTPYGKAFDLKLRIKDSAVKLKLKITKRSSLNSY